MVLYSTLIVHLTLSPPISRVSFTLCHTGLIHHFKVLTFGRSGAQD